MFVANIKRSVSWAPKAVPRVRMHVELGVAKAAGRSDEHCPIVRWE